MILSFNIEYRTNWGEEVRIAGLSPESVPFEFGTKNYHRLK